ncbi:MAG: helix-turn-helix domain-containing protein [Candidatus Kapaibacterium sp.]
MINISTIELENKLQEIAQMQQSILQVLSGLQQEKPTPKIDETLLTVSEVCDVFKVSRQSISAWRRAGKLKAHKVGYLVRFKKSDIDAMLNNGKGNP